MVRQESHTFESEIKTMLSVVNAQNTLEDIISSYEMRIQSVEALLETTHRFLLDFQDSVFDERQEREKINHQLRENLAQNGSLRKKDFDSMISPMSSQQEQQEREVRNLSKSYLSEQATLVRELRESLKSFQAALADGEAQRVREFQVVIKDILSKQEKRKREVTSRLKRFQKEQQEMSTMLKSLLEKGRELRIKDLKSTLAEFKRQCKQRLACRRERKENVQNMLKGFRRERLRRVGDRLALPAKS